MWAGVIDMTSLTLLSLAGALEATGTLTCYYLCIS